MKRRTHTWISSAHCGVAKEGMKANTLSAFLLASQKGADMIETDARRTRDGVLIANHDPTVKGLLDGEQVELEISETDFAVIGRIVRAPDDPMGPQRVATLEQVIHIAYINGMCVNIDLKEKEKDAVNIARLACANGMRGRVVYATNGCGSDVMKKIIEVDPDARFIDRPCNFTADRLAPIADYPKRCFVYTADFSDENIKMIRESGCMLATIGINRDNFLSAVRHHPDMMEYPHTGDFEEIERELISNTVLP